MFQGIFFFIYIQIFQAFGNLEKYFGIKLKKMFRISYINFLSYATFWLKS